MPSKGSKKNTTESQTPMSSPSLAQRLQDPLPSDSAPSFDIGKISIPDEPGVYMMKDASGKIIYIGKAKNLSKRVRSYFFGNQDYKTQKLVAKIADIEFFITDNESEAFLLESNLIKQYRPIYNIELKDQQRYTYLRLTDEKFPRLLVARRMRNGKFLGKGEIYGPFTKGSSKMLSVGLLRKIFKIRICKKLPKKVCLEYHLGNCEGPCEFKSAKDSYQKHVQDLRSILEGKEDMREFYNRLEEEMKEASKKQEYERAKEIRDTLYRLQNLNLDQKMETVQGHNEEYFAIIKNEHTATVMCFRQSHGVIKDKNQFTFDLMADNTFSSFLSQYYGSNPIPSYVVVSEIPEKKNVLEDVLSQRAGHNVKIISPSSGKRKDMIDLILKNLNFAQKRTSTPAVEELRKILRLDSAPNTIECFDISNHGSDFAVGAMSRFVDGLPDKSGYRKFRIKSIKGKRDDYAMISEVVKRRYLRLLEEQKPMPDLVLIDGGKGQLGAALESLKQLDISIPCVSIAKENEDIFTATSMDPVSLPKNSSALKLVQHARDEAHRFGVRYNRTIQKMSLE